MTSLETISKFIGFEIYLTRPTRLNQPLQRLAEINREHADIFKLIANRSAQEAKAAMQNHIERARDEFLGCIPFEPG